MSLLSDIEAIVKSQFQPGTDYIFGFADLRGLLTDEFAAFNSGISICRRLDDRIIDGIINGPTREYYDHYSEINKELALISEKICIELSKLEIECQAVKPSFQLASDEFKPYLQALRYKVSHKMVGTRAGLGWIGKTDLFVSHKFGPRIRLTSILLKPALGLTTVPVNKSECGKCNVCVSKCPAKAATGQLWDINIDRNEFFNPWKCREKCTELGKLLLKQDRGICGICVAVCPKGKN